MRSIAEHKADQKKGRKIKEPPLSRKTVCLFFSQILHQKNADLQARSTAYETSLESVFSSKSWKLTAPIRSLMRLFHRGN